jgi:guanylate kinase
MGGDEGEAIARRGLMLVLSSPSGAGKSTLTQMLLQLDTNVELSISATTRQPRPGEIEGKHYRFVDKIRFTEMIKNDELLEWAEVFGNHYGTPREPVENALASGRDVLFDIDWQGTKQLRERVKEPFVSVFVLPPSVEELERRLTTRAQDSHEVIKGRMAKASGELSHWDEYDYVLTNTILGKTFDQLKAILTAERLKRERQPGLSDFVRGLQAKL